MSKLNGIYFFGGKNNKGKFLNDLRLLKLKCNQGFAERALWQQVKQTGTPPAPRAGHTMGYLPVANALIIVGGTL